MGKGRPIRASESLLTDRLAKLHPAPAWAFLPQVRNQTGFGRRVRTADALALSLYPSRGLHLHGFEIKVDRNDLAREILDPEKAEEIARFCDFWWVVAPAAILAADPGRPLLNIRTAVPETWGILLYDDAEDALVVSRKATRNEHAEPLTRPMLCAILRRVAEELGFYGRDYIHREDLEKEVARRVEAELKRREPGHIQQQFEKLGDRVKAFEEASGIRIADPWIDGRKLGDAVKRTMDLERDAPGSWLLRQAAVQMGRYREQLEALAEAIDETTKSINPEAANG